MSWERAFSKFISGDPRSKGSFRPIKTKDGRVFMAQSKASKSWENTIRELCQGWGAPHDGPVRLLVLFFLPRPKSHYRTGKYAGELREDAPRWPDKTPDIDKLLRAVMDGLTRVLYDDDKRVVSVECEKRYTKATGEVGVGIRAWVWR